MLPTKEKYMSKLALINCLKKSPPDAQSRIINYLNSEGINLLSESVHNVLFNDAPLKSSDKRKSEKSIQRIKKFCWKSRKEGEVLKKGKNF